MLDPARGRALELTGVVEVLWAEPRAWRFRPEARRLRPFPAGVRLHALT